MSFPGVIISPNRNPSLGSVLYLNLWNGITGIVNRKIEPNQLMAQEGQKPFYEFAIDENDEKFKSLMRNRAGQPHFNPNLKIVYIKPEFLTHADTGGEPKVGQKASITPSVEAVRQELHNRIEAKKLRLIKNKRDRGGSPTTRASSPNLNYELMIRRAAREKKIKTNNKNKVGGFHLYKRLGVSRKATKKQIKKAYQKIKNKKGKIPKRVKEAYRILSNPKTRRKYNNSYHHKKTKKHRGRNQRGCSRRKRRRK